MSDLSYFMGQGVVSLAPRLPGGAICGPFVDQGDVDALTVSQTQKHDDIEESRSGNRIQSAHIPISTSLALKMNALQWSAANIAEATYGSYTSSSGGTVTAEAQQAYGGGRMYLANLNVSAVSATLAGATGTINNVVVTAGGTGFTASSLLDCTISGAPGTGATAKALTNAAGAVVAVYVTAAGSGYVSPTASVSGGSGATFVVNMGAATLAATTDYVVSPTTGAVAITSTSTKVPTQTVATPLGYTKGAATLWAYTYAAYTGKIEALMTTVAEYAVRFDGINVADGGSQVVLNLHRVSLDLAKVLAFIEAKHGNLEIGGMLLPDTAQPAGTSMFYNLIKV
jgi:hypothetical protein